MFAVGTDLPSSLGSAGGAVGEAPRSGAVGRCYPIPVVAPGRFMADGGPARAGHALDEVVAHLEGRSEETQSYGLNGAGRKTLPLFDTQPVLEAADEIVRMFDRSPLDNRFADGSVRGGHCRQIERQQQDDQ